jgi:hypothetical protein
MRPIAPFLLPLLALLPQPLAATPLSDALAHESALPAQADTDSGYEPASRDVPADTDETRRQSLAVPASSGAERMSARPRLRSARIAAAYGPFDLVDDFRVAMVGVTDARTPAAFAALLREHPGIAVIEMVDCPGTDDDGANLRLGRMIRARGIATHVPDNGWVASGAVDLFLAGARRSAEPGARFAVHSWEDESGRGPGDYAQNAPQNRAYIDYYRAMGMSEGAARAFYAWTNSAPFSRPRYLTSAEIARWVRFDGGAQVPSATPPVRFAQVQPWPGPALVGVF